MFKSFLLIFNIIDFKLREFCGYECGWFIAAFRRNCNRCQGLIDITAPGASEVNSAPFSLVVTV
jgi:hypothetical protein